MAHALTPSFTGIVIRRIIHESPSLLAASKNNPVMEGMRVRVTAWAPIRRILLLYQHIWFSSSALHQAQWKRSNDTLIWLRCWSRETSTTQSRAEQGREDTLKNVCRNTAELKLDSSSWCCLSARRWCQTASARLQYSSFKPKNRTLKQIRNALRRIGFLI